MNGDIKHHIIKNYILLYFACALLLTTPLSLAMNLQEQYHQKLYEFREALLYRNREKNTSTKKKLTQAFSNILIRHNEQNVFQKIALDDIFPQSIPDKIAEIHLNNLYLITILHNNDKHSRIIFKCMTGLYFHYHEKKLEDVCWMDPEVSLKKESCIRKYFKSLLHEQKKEILQELNLLKTKSLFGSDNHDSDSFLLFLPSLYMILIFILDSKLTKNQNSETLAAISFIIGLIMIFIKTFNLQFVCNEKKRLKEKLEQNDYALNKIKSVKKHDISYKKLIPYKKYFENLYYRAKKYVKENKDTPSFKKYFDEQRKEDDYDYYFLDAELLCVNEFVKHEDPDFF